MRTTLTLDSDVAKRLEAERRRRGTSLKATVNEALRAGLGMSGKNPKPPRFHVKARRLGLKPGIDADKMGQFLDELDAEVYLEKRRQGKI